MWRHARRCRFGNVLLVMVAFAITPAQLLSADVDEFSAGRLLEGATILRTGNGTTLTRTNFPWQAPANLSHPALVFTFGFSTSEQISPGKFFDSLTIVVSNEEQSFVAPALTIDVFGITSAPGNPDGAQFRPHDIEAESLAFPNMVPALQDERAFLVLVSLPPALAGQSGTLSVTFFDNRDSEPSAAFISHRSVVPGPGTFLLLESSAAAAGPYAAEGGLVVRHARRCLVLPRPGAHRFYQMISIAPTRLTSIRAEAGDWVLHYTDDGNTTVGRPTLLSSAQAAGPYAVETAVIWNELERTMRLPQESFVRFFRVNCEVPLTIRNIRREDRQLIIRYEDPIP